MSVSPSEGLPRNERIAKRADFVRIYDEGVKQHGRLVVVFSSPNAFSHPRIGVTATRKFGKAHDRNRVKRWVREVYRRNRAAIGLRDDGVDFVVNVKGAAAAASFDDFSRDLIRTMRKALGSVRQQ
ncbi:MAG: ribonuclease P protein component [Thermoanaerobaculia bacterium]